MSPQYVSGSDASVAKIRHEIRTPLNHIIGYSEILLEEEFSGPFEPLLRSLAAHSREMLSLVQKLLPSQVGSSTALSGNEPREHNGPREHDGKKAVGARDGALQQLSAAVNPHVDQIEELLRKIRAQAPPNAVADLDRIENAAKRLRGVMSGVIAEPAVGVPDLHPQLDSGTEAQSEVEPDQNPQQAPGAILVVDDNDLKS